MTQTRRSASIDPSKTKWAVWIPILVSVSGLVGSGVTWGFGQYAAREKEVTESRKAEQSENNRLLREVLDPIDSKLKLTLSVSNQLHDQLGIGIIEQYVQAARRGDTKQTAISFPLLTDLVQTDAQIVSLLEGYRPYTLTQNFKTQSDRFVEHAHTYIIRVQSLPSIIQAGAPVPNWMPFPQEFPAALAGEIAARTALTTAKSS